MPATSQIPQVWKPVSIGESKKLEGPCEVGYMKLATGSAAAHVSVYDASDTSSVNDGNLKWILDSGVSGNDADHFDPPLVFKKGVVMVLDQGAGTNAEVCLAAHNYLSS